MMILAVLLITIIVPGAVLNLMAESTLTSVLLTWSPPQELNGVIIAYEVTYRISSSCDLLVVNTTDVATSLTINLDVSAEISNVSVRAYTSVGPGKSSYLSVPTTESKIERELCLLMDKHIYN